jgi:hypothetical protein
MLERRRYIFPIAAAIIVAGILMISGKSTSSGPAATANPAASAAADGQKTAGIPAAPPSTPDQTLGSAEEYTKKLLLMMDTDKNGKVSKKEFMAFMSSEFDRLDVDHDGELDVKELAAIRVRPYLGK